MVPGLSLPRGAYLYFRGYGDMVVSLWLTELLGSE